MKSVVPFNPSSFTLEQPFTGVACPYDYVIIGLGVFPHNLSLPGNSMKLFSGSVGKTDQNSKQMEKELSE